jgi:tetratricopeptide (TPR) repeat protein
MFSRFAERSCNSLRLKGSILRNILLCCCLLMFAGRVAASDDDFYQRLYQRGMTHFAAADYAAAFAELRSAAFGFVERVEQFEIAQSYACIAAHRLGHESDARDSLMRLVSAEKVQPRYRSLALPADVRAEVNAVAAKLLTKEEAALLGVSGAETPQVIVPTPMKQPNVAVTAPRKGGPDAHGSAGVPPAADDAHVAAGKMPAVPAAVPQPTVPAPQPAPSPAVGNIDTALADAQRAIDGGDIDRARSIYNELAAAPSLSHTIALRVAEGLYRVRAFAGAAKAFARAGAIGRGEEGYHYYYAVALYETGRYGNAKRELAAAMPYIEVTPEVTRYRAKIEGAIE